MIKLFVRCFQLQPHSVRSAEQIVVSRFEFLLCLSLHRFSFQDALKVDAHAVVNRINLVQVYLAFEFHFVSFLQVFFLDPATQRPQRPNNDYPRRPDYNPRPQPPKQPDYPRTPSYPQTPKTGGNRCRKLENSIRMISVFK
jgi:hypothetical protein